MSYLLLLTMLITMATRWWWPVKFNVRL